jgi:uncharacterized phage infection (PIP) family protein YhgE
MDYRLFRLLSLCLLFVIVAGCGLQAPATAPTPDTNATVNAAVAATEAAKAGMQSTIDAAVASTVIALPTPALPPSPTPVDTMTLSEEELAVIIDQSVNDAITAYDQASTTAGTATSNGAVTQEEVDELYYAYAYAEEEINAALALSEEYLSLYYDLASETVNLLIAVEEDLNTMAEAVSTATDAVVEMGQALASGQEVRSDAISELQSQTQDAANQAQQVKDKLGNWNTNVKGDIENRGDKFTTFQPDHIASDRRGTLQLAQDYFAEVRTVLQGGGKITLDQMNTIAQLGANAGASLKSLGGPEMLDLSSRIDGMTRQISRGELPQARQGLGDLERSIPRR